MKKKELIAALIPVLELLQLLLQSLVEFIDKTRGYGPGQKTRPLSLKETILHMRCMDHWH